MKEIAYLEKDRQIVKRIKKLEERLGYEEKLQRVKEKEEKKMGFRTRMICVDSSRLNPD